MYKTKKKKKAKFSTNLAQVTTKIESLKKWTINTYKTTKYTINEQLSKVYFYLKKKKNCYNNFIQVKKTVDKDLEDRIITLRQLQKLYHNILIYTRTYTHHFIQANKFQKNLSESLYQLSCKEDILKVN